MVLNIGVYPFWGSFSVYDVEAQTILKFNITPVKPEDLNNVDKMFKEIKSKIDEKEISCICFVLEYKYLNKIRKEFIKSAKENGIKNAKIIGGKQARFIGMLGKSGTRPSEDDVIWSLSIWENNIICDVWQKEGHKCVLKNNCGQSKTNKGKESSPTLEDFQNLHKKIGIERQPTVIFVEGFVDESEINKIFSDSKIFVLEKNEHKWTEYALTMARIMHGEDDDKVKDFDVDGVLQRPIELLYNDESILKVEEFEPLPYQNIIYFTRNENVEVKINVLERNIFADEIVLPSDAEGKIELNIDENGIFSYKLI